MSNKSNYNYVTNLNNADYGITVKELFELNIIPEVELIGGKKGSGNLIRAVTVMEAPDFIDWVKKDEFLLTTAYAIANKPVVLHEIIPALSEKGLAALGIKPGRFIDSIPDDMIKLADDFNFPLIKIPHHISFSDLIMPISYAISERQVRYLKLSEKMHEILIKAASEVNGLHYLLGKLHELVNNPISIEVPNFNTIIRIPESYVIHNQPIVRSSKIIDETKRIEKDLAVERRRVYWEGKDIYQTIFPIVAGSEELGKLTVLEVNPLSRLAIAALERSISIAAYEIMKSYAMLAVESRYKNIIVDQLISSSDLEFAQVKERAMIFGWNLSPPYCVIVIEFYDETHKSNERSILNEPHHLIYDLIQKIYPELIVADRGNRLVVIASKPFTKSPNKLEELVNKIQDKLNTCTKKIIYQIGVGRIYTCNEGLSPSYQEAIKAIKINAELNNAKNIVFFKDLGLWRVLSLIQNKDEIKSFVKDTVGEISDYDNNYNTSFLPTLKCYIESNCSINQTAQYFKVHYNTINYRLERIKTLFNIDLHNQQQRLSIELALKFLFE